MEESLRERRRSQHADRDSAGGLAKNGDAVGIAAERCDVALHPLKSGDLIEQAIVARVAIVLSAEFRMRKESERSHAVGHAY